MRGVYETLLPDPGVVCRPSAGGSWTSERGMESQLCVGNGDDQFELSWIE